MQWNSVVLPAPFGPMSTRRSPAATRRETRSTARRPSNSLVSSPTSIAGRTMPTRRAAPPPVPPPEEGQRADERPHDGPGAADDRHQGGLDRDRKGRGDRVD